MNTNKKRLWLNVTSSTFWSRPPVGIIRVEQEVLNALKQNAGSFELHLCIWDQEKFIEVFDTSTRQKMNSQIESPQAVTAPIFPIVSKRAALQLIAQGILSLTPRKLQPFATKSLRRLKPVVIDTLNLIRRRKLSRNNRKIHHQTVSQGTPIAHESTSIFRNGDTFLTLGLDWDHSFHLILSQLKKNHGIKIVSCCYDLIPIKYPQYCTWDTVTFFTRYLLKTALASDLILCISKQTEKDLHELLDDAGAPPVSTSVMRLGDHIRNSNSDLISREYEATTSSKEPYILFISTIERRKNHEVLYRALHILANGPYAKQTPKLIFVGMQGWGVTDLMSDLALDPSVSGMIEIKNHVSDSELEDLYREALFCVYPSLYEGWGLPVAEALARGKVVLASNRGSIPEVGGDLVIYADPWNPTEWAQKILKLTQDHEYRSSLETKIHGSYHPTTWTATTQNILARIEDIT